MITYFCPSCWAEYHHEIERCPACGYTVAEYDSLVFEQKLLVAARHPVPSYRYLAIEILGKLQTPSALPLYREILTGPETDTYLIRLALEAVARYPGPERMELLAAAVDHAFPIIQSRARELLEQVKGGKE